MKRSWTSTGFWIMLGVAGGMLLSNITQTQTLQAVATSSSVEGTMLATGASNNSAVELLWALDEKGRLTVMLFGQGGKLLRAPTADLKDFFKVRGGKKPRFAMVTGRYQIGAQLVDALYVTESSTNTLLVLNPGAQDTIFPIYQGPIRQNVEN